MNTKRITMIIAFLLPALTWTNAQDLKGSYFMESSAYRHELNPALTPSYNYVGVPVLGNIKMDCRGNLGLRNLFFNNDGRTVTYLHPSIPKEQVLEGLHANNKVSANINIQLLGGGFHAWNGYNTISIKARTFMGLDLPYGLFEVTKDLANKNYNIGNANVNAQLFTEVALGHSHQINEHLQLGGKLKLLLGMARMNVELNQINISLEDENQWTVAAEAHAEMNIRGIQIEEKQVEYKNAATPGQPSSYTTFSKLNTDNASILGGLGMAVDFGMACDLGDVLPGMKVSCALLDLGFINWNESHIISNTGNPFVFNGFNNIQIMNGEGESFAQQKDNLVDRVSELYRLDNKGNIGQSFHGIGTTMNVGAEYQLPVYDKVRFGLLGTYRFQGNYSWGEGRLSANYAPLKWLELGVSGSMGTYGGSFGWMINVHPKHLNIFAGMDKCIGKLAKPCIPLSSNVQFSFGINYTW